MTQTSGPASAQDGCILTNFLPFVKSFFNKKYYFSQKKLFSQKKSCIWKEYVLRSHSGGLYLKRKEEIEK